MPVGMNSTTSLLGSAELMWIYANNIPTSISVLV